MLSSITVPLIIYGTSIYMLSLLDLPEKRGRIIQRVVFSFSIIFFVFGLYFIVFLNGSDWQLGLSKALNELFLYGSLFLLLPAVTASAYFG